MGLRAKTLRWDVRKDARIFSSLMLGDVKKWISKGNLKEDDLVWHAGLSGWRRASDQEELKSLFKKTKEE